MKKTVTQLSWIILLGISLCVSCKPKEEQETPIEGEEELVVMTSPLPQDVLPSCVVDSTSFNSWFESGKATENGMVNGYKLSIFGNAIPYINLNIKFK